MITAANVSKTTFFHKKSGYVCSLESRTHLCIHPSMYTLRRKTRSLYIIDYHSVSVYIYIHIKYDIYIYIDGLSNCRLLVWLINRNSLRAASCLVFRTRTYRNSLKPCISSFMFETVAKTCSKF